MAKYANQNTVIIKKTPVKTNFLQVGIKEWEQAAKDCGKSFGAFKLYLYLAGNEEGYNLGLSRVAVENELGIKKTGYYDAIELLQSLGYLKDIGNNKMEFYTKPYFSALEENSSQTENSALEEKINEFSATEEKFVQEENSAIEEKVYNTFNF